jgi:hypothetical protein
VGFAQVTLAGLDDGGFVINDSGKMSGAVPTIEMVLRIPPVELPELHESVLDGLGLLRVESMADLLHSWGDSFDRGVREGRDFGCHLCCFIRRGYSLNFGIDLKFKKIWKKKQVYIFQSPALLELLSQL